MNLERRVAELERQMKIDNVNDSKYCYICNGLFMPGQNVDHKRMGKSKRVIWFHSHCEFTTMGMALLDNL